MIDTNVMVDYALAREPYVFDCDKLFPILMSDDNQLYLSASTIKDIYYFLNKQIKNEKEARKRIKNLVSIFKLLDTTEIMCLRALDSKMADYEDAIMVETAKEYKMDLILTRDKDYKDNKLNKVCSPKELLAILKS